MESSQSTLKPMIAKRRLIVSQARFDAPGRKTVTVEENIKTMFFIRQGISKVDIACEKDQVRANEKAVVNCTIDNMLCEKDVKEVKIKVYRVIACTSSTDSKRYEDRTLLST